MGNMTPGQAYKTCPGGGCIGTPELCSVSEHHHSVSGCSEPADIPAHHQKEE
jgi:hypothetical protein